MFERLTIGARVRDTETMREGQLAGFAENAHRMVRVTADDGGEWWAPEWRVDVI